MTLVEKRLLVIVSVHEFPTCIRGATAWVVTRRAEKTGGRPPMGSTVHGILGGIGAAAGEPCWSEANSFALS